MKRLMFVEHSPGRPVGTVEDWADETQAAAFVAQGIAKFLKPEKAAHEAKAKD
jgi:hypothetical protein